MLSFRDPNKAHTLTSNLEFAGILDPFSKFYSKDFNSSLHPCREIKSATSSPFSYNQKRCVENEVVKQDQTLTNTTY